MKLFFILCTFNLVAFNCLAQGGFLQGTVLANHKPAVNATINILETHQATLTDSAGYFALDNLTSGSYILQATHTGYHKFEKTIRIEPGKLQQVRIYLSPADTLEEVVITGVSRATLIKDNPVAIVAISSRQLQQAAALNIVDALARHVPGLSVVKTGPNVSKPFIRGLGYNRVLILVNGIRQEGQQWGDEHGVELDPYNIDRAEIIKGPASLMYGSDALAGVVSIFSYVPPPLNNSVRGNVTSEYQSNNNLIGNGLRIDFNNNKFLFSLSASNRFAKNYRNRIDGRVYNTSFNEKTLSVISGFNSLNGFSRLGFSLYDNKQGIPDGSRDSLTRKFTRQIFEGEKDIIISRPAATQEELNGYTLSLLHQHVQHYRFYTHNYYQLRNGNIDFNIALQQNIRKEYSHPTRPQQAGMLVKLNTLNYSIRYNIKSFLNTETSLGINGMLQQNKNLDATDFPIPDYNLADGGAFFYGKWKQHQWSISGGVRYDVRQISWNDFYVYADDETGFAKHSFEEIPRATLQFPSYIKLFKGFSASAGVTYQAGKRISLKANIGRAYRAPNITEIASNGLDPGAHIIYLGNRNFDPEFSLQEDLGISARYKDFSADASLFNNNIQNYIYQSLEADATGNPLIDAQGNKTYRYQQDRAQLYGGEIAWSLHPQTLNGWQLANSLSLVYGFNRKADFKGTGNNGERLPLIPPAKISGSLSKKITTFYNAIPSVTPSLEFDSYSQQDRYYGYNNMETKTRGYTLFHCRIQAEIKHTSTQTIYLSLQANNLLDKAYQSHLSRLKYFEYYSQSPNSRFGVYDMGRNICLKITIPF